MTESGQPPKIDTYWSLSPDALMTHLHAEVGGLSTAEAASRLAREGLNALEATTRTGALILFVDQFKSPLARPHRAGG